MKPGVQLFWQYTPSQYSAHQVKMKKIKNHDPNFQVISEYKEHIHKHHISDVNLALNFDPIHQ